MRQRSLISKPALTMTVPGSQIGRHVPHGSWIGSPVAGGWPDRASVRRQWGLGGQRPIEVRASSQRGVAVNGRPPST